MKNTINACCSYFISKLKFPWLDHFKPSATRFFITLNLKSLLTLSNFKYSAFGQKVIKLEMHFVQGRVLPNFLRQSLKKTHLNPIDFLYKILVLTELYFTSDPTAATRASIFAPKGF